MEATKMSLNRREDTWNGMHPGNLETKEMNYLTMGRQAENSKCILPIERSYLKRSHLIWSPSHGTHQRRQIHGDGKNISGLLGIQVEIEKNTGASHPRILMPPLQSPKIPQDGTILGRVTGIAASGAWYHHFLSYPWSSVNLLNFNHSDMHVQESHFCFNLNFLNVRWD